MRRLVPFLAATLLALTDQAQAHAHLRSSTPANQSTLASAPAALSLEFNEAVQLTALTLQKSTGTPQKIAPLPAAASKTITLALTALDAGRYLITWRAVSDDRHIVSGKVEFTIAPPPAR